MISVRSDNRLKAAVLAMKLADRDLKKRINAETRRVIGPVWVSSVNANVASHMDTVVIAKGARIKPGNPPVAIAATSTRPLRGGSFVPADHWPVIEFGTEKQETFSQYPARSSKGKPYTVKRRTRKGLPRYTRGGRVAYPAIKEIAPRAVSLWVQMIVKIYANALDGKRV